MREKFKDIVTATDRFEWVNEAKVTPQETQLCIPPPCLRCTYSNTRAVLRIWPCLRSTGMLIPEPAATKSVPVSQAIMRWRSHLVSDMSF